MRSIQLFQIDIAVTDMRSALAALQQQIRANLGGYVCFVNVHTLTESTTNEELRCALQGATFCLADGMPLVWLSRFKGNSTSRKVSGPDFANEFATLEAARQQGIIGGAPGRAEELAKALGIAATTYAPPMRDFSVRNAKEDWQTFLSRCPAGVPPRIVWVGLGAPKQELWMRAVSPAAPETMFFGVGAAIDFLSGAISRAPEWMRSAGLEWAHRLSQDPKRLWKRYLRTNTRFVLLAARELASDRLASARRGR